MQSRQPNYLHSLAIFQFDCPPRGNVSTGIKYYFFNVIESDQNFVAIETSLLQRSASTDQITTGIHF
ncbi:hypothetical protein CSQ79_07270 [Gloeocapsopsis sp. IPPAS B-1203]|nr:hypothetical protein CSQ79_07270 [Gloeocapsopsis sp. IPPAS B-1203]